MLLWWGGDLSSAPVNRPWGPAAQQPRVQGTTSVSVQDSGWSILALEGLTPLVPAKELCGPECPSCPLTGSLSFVPRLQRGGRFRCVSSSSYTKKEKELACVARAAHPSGKSLSWTKWWESCLLLSLQSAGQHVPAGRAQIPRVDFGCGPQLRPFPPVRQSP